MADEDDNVIRLDPLREEHARAIYEWQTYPGTRKYFRNPQPPQWDEHISWIEKVSSALNEHLFVMRYADKDAGLLRLSPYEDIGGAYEISILVAPDLYGKGIATASLEMVIQKFPSYMLIAEIHKDNAQSIHLFEKCGFVKDDKKSAEIWQLYYRGSSNV